MKKEKLIEYKPYSISRGKKNGYADIIFEDEGLMTVPETSATTIVTLLNEAFQNGVKMTIKDMSINPMPQEGHQPINSFKNKK